MDSSTALVAPDLSGIETRADEPVYSVRAGVRAKKLEIPSVVRRTLAFFDGKRTSRQVFDRARIDVRKGEAILRKLLKMGILEKTDGQDSNTEKGGFNEIDEEFFATELPPIDECDLPFETIGSRMKKMVSKLRRR